MPNNNIAADTYPTNKYAELAESVLIETKVSISGREIKNPINVRLIVKYGTVF